MTDYQAVQKALTEGAEPAMLCAVWRSGSLGATVLRGISYRETLEAREQ